MASAVRRVAPQVGRAQAVGQRPVDGRFYRRRLVFHSESVAQHHRRREEHRQRVGGAGAGDVGRRAVDRLEHARVRPPPSDALGSIPIEPVSIAASSERMSPNMFSVTITSKWRGAAISRIAALSTSRCSSSMFGNSAAVQLAHDLAPQPAGLEHVGLVDARHPRARGAEGDPGDPLDLLARVDAGVRGGVRRSGSSRRSRSRRSARARPAGRCRSIISRLQRARVVQRRQRPDRAQVGEQARGPCAGRAGPARGGAWPGRSCPTSGPPTAASRTASAPRQAASVSSVSAVPWASIDAPPNTCSSYSKLGADRVQDLDRRRDDLGSDPVAGEQDDARAMAARDASRSAAVRPRGHVEPHVLEHERLPGPLEHAVDERLAQLLGQRVEVAHQAHGLDERARLGGVDGLGLEPAVDTSVNPARSSRSAVSSAVA